MGQLQLPTESQFWELRTMKRPVSWSVLWKISLTVCPRTFSQPDRMMLLLPLKQIFSTLCVPKHVVLSIQVHNDSRLSLIDSYMKLLQNTKTNSPTSLTGCQTIKSGKPDR